MQYHPYLAEQLANARRLDVERQARRPHPVRATRDSAARFAGRSRQRLSWNVLRRAGYPLDASVAG